MITTKDYDLIIIGCGPAGMTAAIYATRAELKSVIVDFGPPGGKMVKTSEIENYSGVGTVLGPDLSMNMFEQTQKLNVPFLPEKVLLIKKDSSNLFIVETDGSVLKAPVVIVATGTLERMLSVPGEKEFYGKGVSYCAVCDGSFYKGQDIIVIGGGYGALEEGLYLTKFAKRLILVHRRQGFRADSAIVNEAKTNKKFVFYLDYVVKSINGNGIVNNIEIENVITNKRITLPVKAIFPYIGADPVVNFLKPNFSHVLDKFGYLIADSKLKTIEPGLFAAGDVRQTNLRQIATAVADGARAAQFAIQYLDDLHKQNK